MQLSGTIKPSQTRGGAELFRLRRKHRVFPNVPRYFWRQFDKRWGYPLSVLEETITFSESFGADPHATYFSSEDDEYWFALRSLHSRTCLQARAVLALLTNGLVDPAWVQWRVSHEAATIALFISDHPETAHRYLRHSVVSKNHLAQTLIKTGHPEAPPEDEVAQLERLAGEAKREIEQEYGRRPKSRDYSWSGLATFEQIEAEVQAGWPWRARPEYIFASDRVHATANAGMPPVSEEDNAVFLVGPTNSGLTGPADLACLSLMHATFALMHNAATDDAVTTKMLLLVEMRRAVGAMSWISDPDIQCRGCGGFVEGAEPPEELPPEYRPKPCNCQTHSGPGTP